MEPQSNAENFVENGSASTWIHQHSPRSLWQLMFREDRLFLILSVFIGVFGNRGGADARAHAACPLAGRARHRRAGDSFLSPGARQRRESD